MDKKNENCPSARFMGVFELANNFGFLRSLISNTVNCDLERKNEYINFKEIQ